VTPPSGRVDPGPPPKKLRVYLEVGRRSAFAAAVDWPGWCRRGTGAEAAEVALEALLGYGSRYRGVVGRGLVVAPVEIVGRVPGTATTEFGAPDVEGPWDEVRLTAPEAERQVRLLERCWRAFDRAQRKAPARLPKGPRGGGRDRDAIADHVREAERAYASRLGLRVPTRTPWAEQRTLLATHLRSGEPKGARWTRRYGLRRTAWHVLDHAWELEDKTP